MSEAALQRAAVAYLALAIPYAVTMAIPNAARRTRTGRAMNAIPGLTAGAPDLLIVHAGRAYFIELKSARGRLSDAQRAFHAHLEAAGAHVVTARSLDEVEAAIASWGLPVRAALRAAS